MRKMALVGGMLTLVLAVAPQVQAGFALGDQDKVVFFGNKALVVPDLPMGVETFLRLRYPDSKARFVSYGKHEAGPLMNALERFEKQVVPFKPTVIVLCFGTDDVPPSALEQGHLDKFKTDYTVLVERAKQTGAKLFIMTPMCPDVARKAQLASVQYDETVGKYAEAVRAVAQEKGATLVDWFTASKQYMAAHTNNKRLTLTTDGSYPSILGFAVGMTALLDAWSAEPFNIKISADWNSEAVTVTTGKVSVTKVGEDRIQMKLSDLPLPWVVANRGAVVEEDWPCTKYSGYMLQINNVPEGGIIISEPDGKNALPYLSQQLREGTDLSFVGPLIKLEAVAGFNKWSKGKYDAVARHQDFMQQPIPEPEYQQAYDTYYLGLEQYAEATERILMRQPRKLDVTLDIYKAPPPTERMPGQGEGGPGTPGKVQPTPIGPGGPGDKPTNKARREGKPDPTREVKPGEK